MFKVLRPLYSVLEAGTHWFWTYYTHYIDKLNLSPSLYDPCLLFSQDAVVGLQTDDTLNLGTKRYIEKEEIELKKAGYLAKDIVTLTSNKLLTFNRNKITRFSCGTIELTQKAQCDKITLIDKSDDDYDSAYIRERARGAYIASSVQPEAAFSLSFAAQTTTPSIGDVDALNKRLK